MQNSAMVPYIAYRKLMEKPTEEIHIKYYQVKAALRRARKASLIALCIHLHLQIKILVQIIDYDFRLDDFYRMQRKQNLKNEHRPLKSREGFIPSQDFIDEIYFIEYDYCYTNKYVILETPFQNTFQQQVRTIRRFIPLEDLDDIHPATEFYVDVQYIDLQYERIVGLARQYERPFRLTLQSELDENEEYQNIGPVEEEVLLCSDSSDSFNSSVNIDN